MTVEITESNQPPTDEPLMVSCGNYECLAYFDKHGTCHEWYSDREIKNVKEWIALEY